MTYYKAYYGSWRGDNSVKRVAEGFSIKEVKAAAQAVADRTGETVHIDGERGATHFYMTVKPVADRK